jgi:hypothetical protein
VLATTVLVAALAGLPAVRRPILRALGSMLVLNDPIEPADIIVVACYYCGVLEAADLVGSGVAARVAVFSAPQSPVARELIRRGVPYEDEAATAVRQLRALGVQTVEIIPGAVTGTEDMGRILPPWCDRNRFRSVLVVDDPDHTRRLCRVLHRSFKGHHTKYAVRATRYSGFDPDHWWETRGSTRTGIIELEKLLLDFLTHPIS